MRIVCHPNLIVMVTQQRLVSVLVVTLSLIGSVRELVAAPRGRIDRLSEILVQDRNSKVRLQAAVTLGKLKDRRAVPALLSALYDPHVMVRIGAVSALQRIGDPRALPSLRGLLVSAKDRRLRKLVSNAIRSLSFGLKDRLACLHWATRPFCFWAFRMDST